MHFACRDILLKPMTFAGPNNYLQVPGFFRKPRMFVKFMFRSWDYTGLLMFTRFADDLGALELGLSEGQINVTIFQPGKKKLQFAAGGFRLKVEAEIFGKILSAVASSSGCVLFFQNLRLQAQRRILAHSRFDRKGQPVDPHH